MNERRKSSAFGKVIDEKMLTSFDSQLSGFYAILYCDI